MLPVYSKAVQMFDNWVADGSVAKTVLFGLPNIPIHSAGIVGPTIVLRTKEPLRALRGLKKDGWELKGKNNNMFDLKKDGMGEVRILLVVEC